MAESVGLVASLVALLGAAYKLSKSVHGAVESIRAAPMHIKAISSDTKAMFSVLGTLSGYLMDEDNAVGVLHRIVANDLGEVLTNCISVLKQLQVLVNDFIKEDRSGQNLEKWKTIRLHFKENELQQWRGELVAHKITLSVTIAMANLINTNSTEIATKRIENEVLELKSMVTSLLVRLNASDELQADRDVIIDNYRSTIRRVTRGADSIISEVTWERAISGAQPSVAVSSAGLSEETAESYKTARSMVTVKTSSVVKGTPLGKTNNPSNPQSSFGGDTNHHRLSAARRGNDMNRQINYNSTLGVQRVFVKGPNAKTHALTFECPPTGDEILHQIWNRCGIPPDQVSLRLSGRILTDTSMPIPDADCATIHANIKAIGMGVEDYDVREWDDTSTYRRSLSDLPWHTRYRLRLQYQSSLYGGAISSRSSFWSYDKDLETQQVSFTLFTQGLRRIIRRFDTTTSDTRTLGSGLRSTFSRKGYSQ